MRLYKQEDLHTAMSVLSEDTFTLVDDEIYIADEDVFERACMEVLLAFGSAPPKPGGVWAEHSFNPNVREENERAMQASARWNDDVEKFVGERFHVRPSRIGDFIIAFEIWCLMKKEDSEGK